MSVQAGYATSLMGLVVNANPFQRPSSRETVPLVSLRGVGPLSQTSALLALAPCRTKWVDPPTERFTSASNEGDASSTYQPLADPWLASLSAHFEDTEPPRHP